MNKKMPSEDVAACFNRFERNQNLGFGVFVVTDIDGRAWRIDADSGTYRPLKEDVA